MTSHKRKMEDEIMGIAAAASPSKSKQARTHQESPMDSDQKQDMANGLDDEFLDLIGKMSTLEFGSEKEECGLCTQGILPAEFGNHILKCLPEWEAKQDEEMARELSLKQGFNPDQDHAFVPAEFCPQGASCRRRDAGHFETVSHPPVNCPLCQDLFEVYEVDVHINMCLSVPKAEQEFSKVGKSEQPMMISFGSKPRNNDNTMTDGESKAGAQQLKHFKKPKLAGRVRLTRAQLASISQLVLEHKMKTKAKANGQSQMAMSSDQPVSPGSGSDDDSSLRELLDTFKGLGFDKETLSREVRELEQQQMQIGGQSSSSSKMETKSANSGMNSTTGATSRPNMFIAGLDALTVKIPPRAGFNSPQLGSARLVMTTSPSLAGSSGSSSGATSAIITSSSSDSFAPGGRFSPTKQQHPRDSPQPLSQEQDSDSQPGLTHKSVSFGQQNSMTLAAATSSEAAGMIDSSEPMLELDGFTPEPSDDLGTAKPAGFA